MKNKLKLLGIIALMTIIGFSMTGCDSPTDSREDAPAGPVAPASVAVTAPAATVAQGGSWLFTASVGPTGAPQAVTWSIDTANAGTITTGGLLVPTAAVNTQITVRATAVNHPSVFGTATVTVGQPITPTSVVVTPASAYVVQGGQRQFTATVGPEGAPQAVTWSVAPTGAGTITAGGLLTITDASVGDTLTVTATVVNHPAVSNTANVTVPEPISITVTGIPSQYNNRWGRIRLWCPDAGNIVASASGVSGSEAAFTLWDWNDDGRFATPGDYDVRLEFGDRYDGDLRAYRIAEINITSGANTIPWSAFTFMPPITVTVTGIPSRYQGDNIWGFVAFMVPGTTNEIAGDEAAITGASATFTLTGIVTGTYDVFLAFMDEPDILGIYNVSARNITTSNTIPFNQFAVLPPSVTITVTGIPVEYRNGFGEIGLICAETGDWFDWGESAVSITGSSAAFRFWFTDPGVYDVLLWVQGSARWGEGIAPARNITATTTIPWSAFDFTDGGEVMSVTVTGIPERYHGDWGDLDLYIPGTSNRVAGAEVYSVGSSTTFRLRDVEPGTYDVVLWLNDLGVRYILPYRTISAGVSIPFGQFTLSPQGFSEPIERSGQMSPARPSARPLRPHR